MAAGYCGSSNYPEMARRAPLKISNINDKRRDQKPLTTKEPPLKMRCDICRVKYAFLRAGEVWERGARALDVQTFGSTSFDGSAIDSLLVQRLSKVIHLPLPAGILQRLLDLGSREDSSPADYARLFGSCASLTAKLLTTTNSGGFNPGSSIRKIIQGINLLGTANVRILGLTHGAAAMACQDYLPDPMLLRLWRASVAKACLARYIVAQLDLPRADDGQLVGLFQDAALTEMFPICPELYENTIFLSDRSAEELINLERVRFGDHHGAAGSVLCEVSGLPGEVGRALLSHHQPLPDPGGQELDPLELASRAAGMLPHCCRDWPGESVAAVIAILIEHGWLGGDQHPTHLERVRENYDRMIAPHDLEAFSQERQAALVQAVAVEVADTATDMVRQVHGLLTSAAQMDRELAAINVEAVQLAEQTQEDPLTGALNRNGLEMIGGALLDSLRQSQQSVAVMFMDIDDFKSINDAFGHAKGDEVVTHVADVLRSQLGVSAMVARYGGDEFVALLGGLTAEEAAAAAERLLSAVADAPPVSNAKPVIPALSIGLLWRKTIPAVGIEELISQTDALMYQAKMSGKNRVCKDLQE